MLVFFWLFLRCYPPLHEDIKKKKHIHLYTFFAKLSTPITLLRVLCKFEIVIMFVSHLTPKRQPCQVTYVYAMLFKFILSASVIQTQSQKVNHAFTDPIPVSFLVVGVMQLSVIRQNVTCLTYSSDFTLFSNQLML